MSYTIRKAVANDAETVYRFIKQLARYEKLENEVVGTVADLQNTLFGSNPKAHVLLLEEGGTAVGFVLYFYNYSTFLCRPGIYIEDLYVDESRRGKGYGKALIQHICKLACEEGCGRVEWWCLKWNKPSIDFYHRLGAEEMSEWVSFRLDGAELQEIAKAS